MDGKKTRLMSVLSLRALILVWVLALNGACNKKEDPADVGYKGRNFIVRMKSGSVFTDAFNLYENSAQFQSLNAGESPLAKMIQAQMQSQKNFLSSAAGFGAQISELRINTFTVRFPKEMDVESAVRELKQASDVEYVEPDYQVHAHFTPNDPQVTQQWAHAVVNSYEAWDEEQGSQNVIVAVIDTGVDYTHPDLAANMWTNPGEVAGNGQDDDGNGIVDDVYGADFANNDGNPMADDNPNFHGTHVAGTIGAVGNNNIGVAGHALRVKMMALKFLTNEGFGSVSNAVRCIDYAIAKGAKIMSNSWGGPQSSQELAAAIERARAAGILFVAAAGNGGQDGVGDNNDQYPNFPSNYASDNVVAVAATTQSDTLTSFSNYGSATVDVAAPGQAILSTKNGNSYQSLSGTSMATPLVSGVAALIWSKDPNLTYRQVKQILIDSSDPVASLNNRVVADGRINARAALDMVDNPPNPQPDPTPTPTPTPTPAPTPPPGSGIAPQPLLGGQADIVLNNPNIQIPIAYNVAAFAGASGAYVEISRPNTPFVNPNGFSPDPNRLIWGIQGGLQGFFLLLPAAQLPGWGTYQIRVIPLNQFRQAVGLFSNSSTLTLTPSGF